MKIKEKLKKICMNCKHVYLVEYWRLTITKFCSKKCWYEYWKVNGRSKEICNKISYTLKQKFKNYEIKPSWKGKKLPLKVKEKISKSKKRNYEKFPEIKKQISFTLKNYYKIGNNVWNKNKPYYQIRGKNHPNWKGGKSSLTQKLYHSLEYKIWRKSVFKRDNYTCQECNKRGIYLEAHHIKERCNYPELIFNINNGLTLCSFCHNKTKKGVATCVV